MPRTFLPKNFFRSSQLNSSASTSQEDEPPPPALQNSPAPSQQTTRPANAPQEPEEPQGESDPDLVLISVLQINLNHTKAANQLAAQYALQNEIDILLIQDPYVFQTGLLGFPLGWKHYPSQNKKAWIVITNPKILTTPLKTTFSSVFILINQKPFLTVVGSQYIPPSDNIRLRLDEWSSNFHNDFYNSDFLLGGDFNARSQLWGYSFEDDRGVAMIDLSFQNSLLINNTLGCPPTYHSRGRRGWPDLTLTRNHSNFFSIQDWQVLDVPTGSDHEYITFKITTKTFLQTSHRFKTKYANHKKFHKNLKPSIPYLLDLLNNVLTTEDLDNFTLELISEIQKACKLSYKIKTFPKTKPFVWWNPTLASQRNRLRALSRRIKNIPNDDQLRNSLEISFSREKALYRKSLAKAKCDAWKNYCSKAEKTFGSLFKLAHSKTFKPHEIQFSNNITSPTDSFERIKFLTSEIFGNDPAPILSPIPNSSHDEPITPYELKEAIKTINKNKAPGNDCIDARILEQVYLLNKNLLLNWLNSCFSLSHFPTPLRNGVIVYFLKPHKEPNLPTSYRPICLLPTLSKLLEKIINYRLTFHLETSHFFSENQHGFRERKSCETALLALTNIINYNRTHKLLTHVISIDIHKAFDAVHWPTLIDTLKSSRSPAVLINLIITFLQSRYIIINSGEKTFKHFLSKGCPQGSVLGPTLWLVMAQNILNNFNNQPASLIAFADDFLIISSGENRRSVEKKSQKALNHFSALAINNHLTISNDKTYHFTFNKSGAVLKRLPTIRLNDKFIPRKKYLVYLGLTLQHNLRWYGHIRSIKQKVQLQHLSLNRVSGRLWGVPGSLLKIWYSTTSERSYAYASAIWATDLIESEIKLLHTCQRPFLLKITRPYKTAPTHGLNTLAGIPPLHLTLKYDGLRAQVLQLGKRPPSLTFLKDLPISIKSKSNHLRPSQKKFSFSAANPDSKSSFNIFTDGSKSDDGVGAAFAVLHNDIQIFTNSFKLNSEATVFQAELQAILQALTWLQNNHSSLNIKNIHLYSDSQASLFAISKFKQQIPSIQKIQTLLKTLNLSTNIQLFWVKGHAGCSGNEIADTLAKTATKKPTIDISLPLAPSYIKSKLHQLKMREWQNFWINSDRGRPTFTYLPRVSDNILFDSPYINCLLTNHGPFPQYLHRFTFINSPLCVCGEMGTAQHYMFDCQLTSNFHFRRPSAQYWEKWSMDLNFSKVLRRRAQLLVTWLQEHQSDLEFV